MTAHLISKSVQIFLLVLNCLQGLAPTYLSDLLHRYNPQYTGLRSATHHLLKELRSHNSFDDCAFTISAPRLWNKLPNHIKNCTTICRSNYLLTSRTVPLFVAVRHLLKLTWFKMLLSNYLAVCNYCLLGLCIFLILWCFLCLSQRSEGPFLGQRLALCKWPY